MCATVSYLKVLFVKGEMSAKTTHQRSAKGPVSISECAADGRYVALENTGGKEESLSGWRLKRVIDGMEKADQTLDKLSLRPGGKVKVKLYNLAESLTPATYPGIKESLVE